jgi:hypothetical protein
MMLCGMHLHPSWETLVLTLCANKPTFFHLLPSSPPACRLTLCFWLMAFAHWPMLSLLIPIRLTWFRALHCFRGWLWRWWQRKDFIEFDILQTYFSFWPLRYLGVYTNKLIIFFIDMLTWHGQWRAIKTLFFWFWRQFISRC